MGAFEKVSALIGEQQLNLLKKSSVALFGIGGVGGFVAEALIRSGVGKLTIFDNDVVSESNINRQIIADTKTVGKDKISVMKERLLSINPEAEINAHKIFYLPENATEYPLDGYDYVIDAVDTVTAKLEIITRAKRALVPVISCMGTAGKLDITALKVSDVSKTFGCPLARVMRRELKLRGIKGVKVVYSEESLAVADNIEQAPNGKNTPPSMIFVPGAAGLMIAKEVVLDLITKGERE